MQTCYPFFRLFLLDFTLIKTDSLSIRSNHHWCFCPHWKWPFYELNVVSHTHRKQHKLVNPAVIEGSLIWEVCYCVIVHSEFTGKTPLNKPKQADLQWYCLCFILWTCQMKESSKVNLNCCNINAALLTQELRICKMGIIADHKTT